MSVLDGLQLGWSRRLPMILQTEAAECGVACLAMIAGNYGHHTDLADMRRRYGVSMMGATLKDLVRIAEHLHLASRPVRLELEELQLLKTPCILHWDLNHFVVLKSVKNNHVVIHDPASGIRRLSLKEITNSFTGVALELAPTSEFKSSERPPRVRFSTILGRMVGLKRSLFQLLLLALAIEVFAIAAPLFMQWVVDHALISADQELLLTLVIGFAMLLVIRTAVTAMRGWMLMVLGASLHVQSRTGLFSHLVSLPTAFFETRHMGDIMSRFESQETILEAITTELLEVILDGLMVGLTLFIMYLYSPLLASIVIGGASLYGLLRWALYNRFRQAQAEEIVWEARQDSHFLETLRGVTTIKLFNAQEDRRSHWLHLLVETMNRKLTGEKLELLFSTAQSLLFGALTLIVVWLGARSVLASTMSIGMLLAFIAYKDQFLERIGELIDKGVELQMLRLHAERLADIALTPPEPKKFWTPDAIETRSAAIEVSNVSFRYGQNDPWILRNISFRIQPGESVAITGPSGCGKTTLLKILSGLLEPTEGEILIDGEPVSRMGVDAYRSMIGVVMQDDQLFAGSILDNICFFSNSPDVDRVESCAELAAVDLEIEDMSMGYQTLIGDMGTVLSGGQKQRILIARALYRQPRILLLDEATSHLDTRREREVSAAIRAIQMTRIIVAHRPETVGTADRVIRLDYGRVMRDAPALTSDSASRPSLSTISTVT